MTNWQNNVNLIDWRSKWPNTSDGMLGGKWGNMFGGGQAASTGTPPATQTPTATPQAALGLLTRPYTNPWLSRGGGLGVGQQMGGFGNLGSGAGLGGFQAPSYGAQAGAQRLANQGDYINSNGTSGAGGAGSQYARSGGMGWTPNPNEFYQRNSSGSWSTVAPGTYIDPNDWRSYNQNPIWFYENQIADGPGWSALGFMEKDDQPRFVPSNAAMRVDINR